MGLLKKHIEKRQNKINLKNRERLTNNEPVLICSNCLGGYIYHWLGLKFHSPFINLWMTNEDFIAMLEMGLEKFLYLPIKEVKDSKEKYPVGEIDGIKIYFMHYKNFDEAVEAWNRRKERVDLDNVGILFSSFKGDEDIIRRFDKLPYKNKVIFVEEPSEYKSAYYIKGYKLYKKIMKKLKPKMVPNLFKNQNCLTGKRFIDQFDYVSFINSLK